MTHKNFNRCIFSAVLAANIIFTPIAKTEPLLKEKSTSFRLGEYFDFKPEGNMLFLMNKDIPGVIGKVGMILSDSNVNIGEYLLSRTISKERAYSVVKVDEQINQELLNQLIKIDEILEVNQISV